MHVWVSKSKMLRPGYSWNLNFSVTEGQIMKTSLKCKKISTALLRNNVACSRNYCCHFWFTTLTAEPASILHKHSSYLTDNNVYSCYITDVVTYHSGYYCHTAVATETQQCVSFVLLHYMSLSVFIATLCRREQWNVIRSSCKVPDIFGRF